MLLSRGVTDELTALKHFENQNVRATALGCLAQMLILNKDILSYFANNANIFVVLVYNRHYVL